MSTGEPTVMPSACWLVYISLEIIYTISYEDALLGGVVMKLDSIGKNLRKCRLDKKLRQEDLAEKTDLSVTYIGMLERSEKLPSLETFLTIINALGVSADVILADVTENGYLIKNSLLNDKLSRLNPDDRNKIYDVIDTMINHSKQNIL